MPSNDAEEQGLRPAVTEMRAMLAARCRAALRDTVFTNRGEVRPGAVRGIAERHADALLRFLSDRNAGGPHQHGAELCRAGLGQEAFFSLLRSATEAVGAVPAGDRLDAMLALSAFQETAVTSFCAAREQVLLEEQERIREALQRTLTRYTVQMEVASEVARAATSIRDLNELLSTVVELIRGPFGLSRVGVFLVDPHGTAATLRAEAGAQAHTTPDAAHVAIGDRDPVGECLADRKPRLLRGQIDGAALSRLALPMVLHGAISGAIDVESRHSDAFSEQDVAALGLIAGQLAKAIENARLFAELEQRVEERTAELSRANTALRQQIAERQQAEAAMRESEMRFRSVAESANDAIISTDSQATIVFWNGGAARLFGYAEDEALGKGFFDLVPERLRDQLAGPGRAHALSRVVGRTVELRGRRKDNQEFPIELSLASWQTAAGTFFTAIVRDVTERRYAERIRVERTRAVEHARALEYSNRELEQFAYTASHDLQEPLRKIQAFGDRLKTRYAQALDEQGRDYLSRMQNAAARMQNLINDLLTYSRVTTRTQPFVPVDLSEIAREVVGDLEVRIEQTQGSVELGPLPTLDADPTQMRQLLQNLVGNALKFHKKAVQPRVRLHGDIVPAEAGDDPAPAGGWCRFMVEDNGIGIDEKYLDRIFTVFQRLHGRDEYEGTGVGLAVCRRIAERHGGRILASSQPGVGSSFTVMLPARQPGAPGATP